MKNHIPFQWLNNEQQKGFLTLSAVTTIILFVVLHVINIPLQTAAAPNGIISLELAGTLEKSQAMLHSWDAQAAVYAGFSLGIDFVFLLAYSLFLGFACYRIARDFKSRFNWLYQIGLVIAYLQLVAGLLDAIENIALFRLLLGSGNPALSSVAFYCAGTKFLFVFAGIGYIFAGGIILLVLARRKTQTDY